ADTIEAADGEERKRRRCSPGEIELGDRLTEAHRPALVDQDIDRHIFFFDKLAQHQPVEPRKDAPIDVAEVIAGLVLSEVSELDRRAPTGRSPLAAHGPGKRAARLYPEAFELSQEGGIEKAFCHAGVVDFA